MIFSCRGILFDLDGVLVDSTGAVARVWRRWAQKHGLPAKLVIQTAHGRRSIETIRLLTPHLGAESENRIVEAMEIADQEGVAALPGAAELLRAVPPDRYSIVTSATRALATARMSHAGLPLPRLSVTADDVREGKPSPQPYLKGAALLGLAPGDCMVFEDTPAGVESAHRAGMRSIALTTTFPKNELDAANAIVASLADVRATIEPRCIHLDVKEAGKES
ncbi:MAG TPA: HAD family hydrolase [Candidatus Angelobacter sp.]|nr:HAD family hydrolase [Candidatus Angelobacter sp.]